MTRKTYSGAGNVVLLTPTDDDVLLENSGPDWDTVEGSNGTIELLGAYAGVFGGADNVYFASYTADAVALYAANGAWDGVTGSYGVVELNSVKAAVYGGDDTINFSSGIDDVAALFNSNGAWDGVFGSNGGVELNSVKAAIYGDDNTVFFAGGGGNIAALFNAGEVTYEGLPGVGGDVVYGSHGEIELENGSTAMIFGGNNLVLLFGGVAVLSEADTWNEVKGVGTVVLNGGNAQIDDGNVAVSFQSTGSAATFFDDDYNNVSGSGGVLELVNASVFIGDGGDETVYFGAGQNVLLDYTLRYVNNFPGPNTYVFHNTFNTFEQDTIYGYSSSDTLVFSPDYQGELTFSQSGDDVVITLGVSNPVTPSSTVRLSNTQVSSVGLIVYR